MAVRSNYIKNLMESKDSLDKQYQEVIAESMKNIIGENAKDEVRKLLKEAEDEDSFEEEEVENDTASTDNDEVIDTDSEVSDDTEGETTDVEDGIEDTDSVDGGEDGDIEDTADDDLWNDLEKCKSADGEYDCTGMDDGNLLKVLKAMGPEDGIRVMSNGDGTVEVEVDGDMIDGQQEFIIDLDDFNVDTEDGEDAEVELELNEENLGYMDQPGKKGEYKGYQGKTAMTTDPDESLPTDDKVIGHTWNPQLKNANVDDGKDGDRQPFNKNVNEGVDECDTIFEIEEDGGEMVDEASRTVGGSSTSVGHGVTMSKRRKDGQPYNAHNMRSPEEGQETSTTDAYSPIKESVDFKKKVNRLWEENKQMKSIIPQLNEKLMESMVINASMGYIVRLLNENSTTVDEKKQISERFTKVNTLEESKKLYETISEELKNVNRTNNVNGIINSQLAEGKQAKQSLVETTMYKSEKVNEALDFMKRLNKIK